jgi:hypothetical protein
LCLQACGTTWKTPQKILESSMRAAYGITPYLDCASGSCCGLGSFLWTLFHHLPLIWLQDQLQGFVWKGADALPRAPITKCVWLQLPFAYGTPAGYAALFNVAYNVRCHFTHNNFIAHQSNIMSVHLSVHLLAGHDFCSDSWQV